MYKKTGIFSVLLTMAFFAKLILTLLNKDHACEQMERATVHCSFHHTVNVKLNQIYYSTKVLYIYGVPEHCSTLYTTAYLCGNGIYLRVGRTLHHDYLKAFSGLYIPLLY